MEGITSAPESSPAPQGESQGMEGESSPAPAQPQQTDDFSRRFEYISKKEREILERERRFRERESKVGEYEREAQEMRSITEMAKYDPMALMEKFGWNLDKLNNYIQNSDGLQGPEKQKLLNRIDELEQRLNGQEKQKETEKYHTIYSGAINKISSIVDSNPDKYELIKENNQQELVLTVMHQHHQKNGTIMRYEDACEHVENYLDQELEKLAKLKKLRSKFGPPPSEQNEEDQSYGRPTTITNSFNSSAPPQRQPMSKEESLRNAAKLIRFRED